MPANEGQPQNTEPSERHNQAGRKNHPMQALLALFSGQGARAGYLAAVDQGVISLANFMATLILARNVTPTELGVYSVGFTSLRLVRAVQEGITIQPLNAFGAALEDQDFKRYATSTSLIQLALALCGAGAAAILGWSLTQMGNDTLGPTVFALWPAFLWWQLQEYIRRALYARGKVFSAALNTGLANIIRLVLMFWWVSQGELTGAAGLNAIAIGSLAALILGLMQTRTFWTRDISSLPETRYYQLCGSRGLPRHPDPGGACTLAAARNRHFPDAAGSPGLPRKGLASPGTPDAVDLPGFRDPHPGVALPGSPFLRAIITPAL